jgi:hypothetical protein
MLKKWFVGIFSVLLGVGCGPEITLTPSSETHVVVDSFIQNEGVEAIDFLGIVDTSCSMADGDLTAVGEGMVGLRQDIESLTTDYTFGFLTADILSYDFNGPYDSSHTDLDLKMGINNLNGTWSEGAFAALYNYSTYDPAPFMRDDAELVIFMFSDEKEQSPITAQEVKDWIDQRWSDKMVDVVTIVSSQAAYPPVSDGTPQSCGDYAPKYIELANLFNKPPLDLCFDDWSEWLSQSSFLTELKDRIVLSEEPIPSTIVVYLDGVKSYAWSYEESTNTVWLEAVPDYGVLVEVGYDVKD